MRVALIVQLVMMMLNACTQQLDLRSTKTGCRDVFYNIGRVMFEYFYRREQGILCKGSEHVVLQVIVLWRQWMLRMEWCSQ